MSEIPFFTLQSKIEKLLPYFEAYINNPYELYKDIYTTDLPKHWSLERKERACLNVWKGMYENERQKTLFIALAPYYLYVINL